MRALWISLVIFGLMIVLIAVGTWYGRYVCEDMQQAIDALPDTPDDRAAAQAAELRDEWRERTPWLRPILNRTVVRTMSDLVSDFAIYADPAIDALPEYRSTKQKLLGAIDEMRRAEKATFGLWS